jgi:hypothetical protein
MLPVLPVIFVSVWQQNHRKSGAPILQLEGGKDRNPRRGLADFYSTENSKEPGFLSFQTE